MAQQGQVDINVNVDSGNSLAKLNNINNTLNKLSGSVGGLSKMGESFGNTLKTIGGAFAAFEVIGEIKEVFTGLVENFDKFNEKVLNLAENTKISETAIKGLQDTVAKLSTNFQAIGYEVLTAIAPAFTKISDNVLNNVYKIIDGIKVPFTGITNNLIQAFDSITPVIIKLGNLFGSIFTTIAPTIFKVFDVIVGTLDGIIGQVETFITTFDISKTLDIWSSSLTNILSLLNPILGLINEVYIALKPITDVLMFFNKLLLDGVIWAIKIIVGLWTQVFEGINYVTNGIGEWLMSFDGVKSAITWIGDKFTALYRTIIVPIVDAFEFIAGVNPTVAQGKGGGLFFKGLADLAKINGNQRPDYKLATEPLKGGGMKEGTSTKSSGMTADKTSQQVRSLTINIEKQIGIENFISQSVQAGAAEVERLLKQAMTRAVTDTRFAT